METVSSPVNPSSTSAALNPTEKECPAACRGVRRSRNDRFESILMIIRPARHDGGVTYSASAEPGSYASDTAKGGKGDATNGARRDEVETTPAGKGERSEKSEKKDMPFLTGFPGSLTPSPETIAAIPGTCGDPPATSDSQTLYAAPEAVATALSPEGTAPRDESPAALLLPTGVGKSEAAPVDAPIATVPIDAVSPYAHPAKGTVTADAEELFTLIEGGAGRAPNRHTGPAPAPEEEGASSFPPGAEGKTSPAERGTTPAIGALLSGAEEPERTGDVPGKRRDAVSARDGDLIDPAGPPTYAAERVASEKPAALRPPDAAPPLRGVRFEENAFLITRKSHTSVEVTLAPPGVGKLEIEVVLEKGIVNARITAADPAGREAIRQSLPQIVESLARDGMNIGGFTVSLKDRRNPPGDEAAKGAPSDAEARPRAAVAPVASPAAAPAGRINIFV